MRSYTGFMMIEPQIRTQRVAWASYHGMRVLLTGVLTGELAQKTGLSASGL